jgi:hypothetical protein
MVLVAGLGIAAALFLQPRASSTTEVYPDHVLTRGGSGAQAWIVVAFGVRNGEEPPQGCAELRDANGARGASGCGYRSDDRSADVFSYSVGELPGDDLVFFGPAPEAAATVELRFPLEPPVRVPTVAVDGLPGRFFVVRHRAIDFSDPESFPDADALDAAGHRLRIAQPS